MSFFYKSLIRRCFVIIAALACHGSVGFAQISDQDLQAGCVQQVPAYVENMCARRSVSADKWALALPERCLSLGLGEGVAQKLRQCEAGNVYSDVWKFRYALGEDIRQSFVEYVDAARSVWDAGLEDAPIPSINVFEIYNITFLACGDDAKCHAEFFNLIPKDVRDYMVLTPLYCDYGDAGNFAFDAMFTDYLIDETSTSGFRHPVCQAFYCTVNGCGVEEKTAPAGHPFILDEMWRDYYARTYGG
ncbi:hypothetical protein ABFT80_08170 [Mesorhizobium sp. SB112]|uniref:hypothetical protein n=1 Tax=Mesorhizobium sp. SB112 TaxID=3151853 RepID=UPI0032660E98